MFGLFRPKCPIEVREKAWTESRMAWLAEQLGLDRLQRATVLLPTAESFPEAFGIEPLDPERVLVRVCAHMGVERSEIDLEIFEDDDGVGGAGGYYVEEHPETGRPTVMVASYVLEDRTRLVVVLAHEVAHHILLGGDLQDGHESDMEEVTDLVPLALGLGVFAANDVLREQATTLLNAHYWSMGRTGYLPGRIHGYALALFATCREETDADWMRCLRLDVSSVLRKGLRYLHRTGDSIFPRLSSTSTSSVPGLLADLETGTPSRQLLAIWELVEREETSAAFNDLLEDRARDNRTELGVRIEAVRALGRIGEPAVRSRVTLIDLLRNRSEQLRCTAAVSLGRIGGEDLEGSANAIGKQLLVDERNFLTSAMLGLAELGQWPTENGDIVAKFVFEKLERAACEFRLDIAGHLLLGLTRSLPDFDSELAAHLKFADPEVVREIRTVAGEIATADITPYYAETRGAFLLKPIRAWNDGF